MREVSVRQFRACLVAELANLPVAITRDGEVVAVLMSVSQHNQLVRQYVQAKPNTATQCTQSGDTRFRQAGIVPNRVYREHGQDVRQSEPPWYNPQLHKPGDLVRVQRGKQVLTLTVPDLDGDGHPVPP